MGQAQSDEHRCDEEEQEAQTEDVSDLEINSVKEQELGDSLRRCAFGSPKKLTLQQDGTNKFQNNCTTTKEQQLKQQQQQQQHVRKLSNVSNRNIQLLSIRPRSEKDAYADNLRSRRRSSLINLILGAPSSGPRFSDDLCSLSSHMSELNFGIEFFPDPIYHQHQHQHYLHHHHYNSNQTTNTNTSSVASSLHRLESPACLDDGAEGAPSDGSRYRRRRSSLGSLKELAGGVIKGQQQQQLQVMGKEPQGEQEVEVDASERMEEEKKKKREQLEAPSAIGHQGRYQQFRKPSLASTLASIDLTSSFEQHYDEKASKGGGGGGFFSNSSKPPLSQTKQTIFSANLQAYLGGSPDHKTRPSRSRVNQAGRVLKRAGSELSLYSTVSAASSTAGHLQSQRNQVDRHGRERMGRKSSAPTPTPEDLRKETKLIIILQVCLPFILAGFGNMAAGLVLNHVSQWRVFQRVPTFFILLPPFIGLKGNIEMTLASRLSTLSNLNLLDTGHQRLRAYESNLVLTLSQAIGLSVFATFVSTLCEFLVGGGTAAGSGSMNSGEKILELLEISIMVVLASALLTSILLVYASSIIVSLAVALANLIQVNPDNLSTLIAALYGDVSCVLVYGLVAEWMFSLREQQILVWPIFIIICALVSWPILLFAAYKFKETRRIAISSIPPMLASIMVSMGSGAVLSLVIGRFKLIALYQPVVNGFGANLIAVQASRVSTWLWCSALREASSTTTMGAIEPQREATAASSPAVKTLDSLALAQFSQPMGAAIVQVDDKDVKMEKDGTSNKMTKIGSVQALLVLLLELIRKPLWSFCNSSPNSVAARLLLIMLIPAHTIYFLVIWLLAPERHVTLTWQFYLVYVFLCVIQVFILLTICEPLMTLLMRRNLDPDIFGISLLMALADLIGTLCLTGAFYTLAALGDSNAQ